MHKKHTGHVTQDSCCTDHTPCADNTSSQCNRTPGLLHSFVRSFVHSFIHSAASLNARAARARTSEARVTPHAAHTRASFLKWCSAFCPRLLRLLALLRFVGTRPSRYVVTTGDTRTFPSVSCVVWESVCGSSLDDGYANVSGTTVAQQLTVSPFFLLDCDAVFVVFAYFCGGTCCLCFRRPCRCVPPNGPRSEHPWALMSPTSEHSGGDTNGFKMSIPKLLESRQHET